MVKKRLLLQNLQLIANYFMFFDLRFMIYFVPLWRITINKRLIIELYEISFDNHT
jgi:hypothetical protein